MSQMINESSASSLEELLQKSNVPGSSFYYSILSLDKNNQRKLSILFALFNEWLKLSQNRQEAQVANTALAWWLEQITLFATLNNSQQARHPLLQALTFLDDNKEIRLQVIAHMQNILLTFIQKPTAFQKESLLTDYLKNTWGRFCILSNIALTHTLEDSNSIQLSEQIGLSIGFHHVVKCLASDLGQQRCSLPQDWLKDCASSQQELLSHLKSSSQSIVKNSIITKITDTIQDQQHAITALLTRNLSNFTQYSHLPSLIAWKLESTRLQLTLQKDFRVLEYRLQLSPLKKLWLSWRCKRHYNKGRVSKLSVPR